VSARDHHVAGQPPDWSRPGNLFRKLDGAPVEYSADWYMRDEEREDDARVQHSTRLGAVRRRIVMWIAVRRERRAFRRALRNYRGKVHPMAESGHSIVDSWYFLIPFGLMVVGVLIARVWGVL
jgi:hypothetical protein